MMRVLQTLLVASVWLVVAAAPAPRGSSDVLPLHGSVPAPAALAGRTVRPLPTWTYTVTASPDLYGGNYSGQMIGSSPFASRKTRATVKVQIVPLVVTINDGTTIQVYDPTKPDACNDGHPTVHAVLHSPLFVHVPWTMNGVKIGTTQYVDAFQRAQFWSLVQNSNYHLFFKPSVLPAQAEHFVGAANGTNFNAAAMWGGCGWLGVVNQNDLDARVRSLITGALAGRVNAGTVPVFLLKNVATASTGAGLITCCALGYHSALMVGGNLQVYVPVEYDTTGVFGSITDALILSHELGETMNDPTGNNLTPMWGRIGQLIDGCQGNIEVGDPLTPGNTASNTFAVPGPDGTIYHMQELAFFSWFYGGASLGAGGRYSDNGTFGGDAIPCNAGGGTN